MDYELWILEAFKNIFICITRERKREAREMKDSEERVGADA